MYFLHCTWKSRSRIRIVCIHYAFFFCSWMVSIHVMPAFLGLEFVGDAQTLYGSCVVFSVYVPCIHLRINLSCLCMFSTCWQTPRSFQNLNRQEQIVRGKPQSFRTVWPLSSWIEILWKMGVSYKSILPAGHSTL